MWVARKSTPSGQTLTYIVVAHELENKKANLSMEYFAIPVNETDFKELIEFIESQGIMLEQAG